MISSIFSKTKPINYIFLMVFLVLSMFMYHIFVFKTVFNATDIIHFSGIFATLVFAMFVTSFIDGKNSLTENNHFVIALFVLLLNFFPSVYDNLNLVVANIFVLLSFRRMISLKNNTTIKAKIFDASLWVGVAMFFNVWCGFFMLLVFIAVWFFQPKDIRNWLIPFVALAMLSLFFLVFRLYYGKLTIETTGIVVNADYNKFLQLHYALPISFLLVIGVWAVLVFVSAFQTKSINLQRPYWLLIFSLLISTVLSLFTSVNDGSEFIFIIFPLAIIISTLLEKLKKNWMKEMIFWLCLVIPAIASML